MTVDKETLSLFHEKDITRNRHRDADTSVEAFNTTPSLVRAKQRAQVLGAIKAHGGLTTEEVSVRLGIAYTAASARMSELKRDGHIKDSGKRRPTTHGKNARVMVLP